ncbi:hypothetical protein AB1286_03560 [Trinickia sp. NRRL B-1857]
MPIALLWALCLGTVVASTDDGLTTDGVTEVRNELTGQDSPKQRPL